MKPLNQVEVRRPNPENEYSIGIDLVFENFEIAVGETEIANKVITIYKSGAYPVLKYHGLVAEITTEVAEKLAKEANISC